MNKKIIFLVFIIIVFLIGGFFIVKNYSNEKDESVDKELPKEDMIIVYKEGKEIKLLSDNPNFQEIKDEIENLVINIDNGYELIPSESQFNAIKKKGCAVELIYFSSKELSIKFLEKPISVIKIFIPLEESDFPTGSIFVYEYGHEDFPHTLANIEQSRNKLLNLIEPLN